MAIIINFNIFLDYRLQNYRIKNPNYRIKYPNPTSLLSVSCEEHCRNKHIIGVAEASAWLIYTRGWSIVQYWLTIYNRFHMCNTEVVGKSESSCTECDAQLRAFQTHTNMDWKHRNSPHSWMDSYLWKENAFFKACFCQYCTFCFTGVSEVVVTRCK